MADTYDVIIVGGGIGGGSLATVLARAGKSVLVLEKATVHRDRVRGEWIAPWGVVELKRLGLYDDIIRAGAHHIARHISFGDDVTPEEAIAETRRLDTLLPDIAGPLCFGHPASCDLWTDTATAAGATLLRGVTIASVTMGTSPSVTYTRGGAETTARARIVIGADGRGSFVRKAAGIELHRDPTHHLFSGMLVEDAHNWPDDLQVIGTEGDVNYFAFRRATAGSAFTWASRPTTRTLWRARVPSSVSWTPSSCTPVRAASILQAPGRPAPAMPTPTKTPGPTSRSSRDAC